MGHDPHDDETHRSAAESAASGTTGSATWDWVEVRALLIASFARNAADHRNTVVVLLVDPLPPQEEVDITFLDRRDGTRYQERFDLARCAAAYDVTTIEQLAAMVYADLEESVLCRPALRPATGRPGA